MDRKDEIWKKWVDIFGLFGKILVDGLSEENLNDKADDKKGDCPLIDQNY